MSAGTPRPQEPITIGAAVVGIQIDVHTRDQAVAKFKDAAESAAGRFAAVPLGTVSRLTARRAFHHHCAADRDVRQTAPIVGNRL